MHEQDPRQEQEPTGWPRRAADHELAGEMDESSSEALEEENPVHSPQSDRRDADQERAAFTDEPEQPVAKSTEGLTVGGSEATVEREREARNAAQPSTSDSGTTPMAGDSHPSAAARRSGQDVAAGEGAEDRESRDPA